MKHDNSTDKAAGGISPMQTVTLAATVAACVATGILLLSGTSGLVQASAVPKPEAWPLGPADPQVARRHGQLDHSVLLAPGIQTQPEHPGRAIASYDAATD